MFFFACSGVRGPRPMLSGYSSGLSASGISGCLAAVSEMYVKRVSCVWFVRVGRFPARAATSVPASLFSCALGSLCCLERRRVSCVAYLPDGIVACYVAPSPRVARATRGDTEASLAIRARCARRRPERGSHGPARSLGFGTSCGHGVLGPYLPGQSVVASYGRRSSPSRTLRRPRGWGGNVRGRRRTGVLPG